MKGEFDLRVYNSFQERNKRCMRGILIQSKVLFVLLWNVVLFVMMTRESRGCLFVIAIVSTPLISVHRPSTPKIISINILPR